MEIEQEADLFFSHERNADNIPHIYRSIDVGLPKKTDGYKNESNMFI